MCVDVCGFVKHRMSMPIETLMCKKLIDLSVTYNLMLLLNKLANYDFKAGFWHTGDTI